MITRDLADTNLHLAHYHWVHVTYKNNTSGRERERVNSQTKLSYPESRYLNTSWGAEGLSRMDSSRHLGGNCPARFSNSSLGLKTWVELSLSPIAPAGEESIRLKSATVPARTGNPRQLLSGQIFYMTESPELSYTTQDCLNPRNCTGPLTSYMLKWNTDGVGVFKNSRWKRRQK